MRNNATHEAVFQTIQQEFAAHIRQPQKKPIPEGVPAQRMAIYSELFFNNVESFLADSFPVIRQLLPQEYWYGMARDFFARHACGTPLFTCLGEEFLLYLQQERGLQEEDPPYLAELAHYEWVELALTLSDAEPLPSLSTPAGNLLQSTLQLSPLAWPLCYRFPVHLIGGDNRSVSVEESPRHLLVYRNHEDQVIFLEIDALTHALLSVLQSEGSVTAGELLQTLAEISGSVSNAEFIEKGRVLFESLMARGVVGIVPASAESALLEAAG